MLLALLALLGSLVRWVPSSHDRAVTATAHRVGSSRSEMVRVFQKEASTNPLSSTPGMAIGTLSREWERAGVVGERREGRERGEWGDGMDGLMGIGMGCERGDGK